MLKAMQTLQEVVDSLQCNDPSVSQVQSNNFPIGYGRSLGEALLQSTNVTDLQLWTGDMFSNDESRTSKRESTNHPLTRYLRTSSSLRKVLVRVPNRWKDRLTVGGKQHLLAMLEAMANNSHVEQFPCEYVPSYQGLECVLKTTRSIHTSVLWRFALSLKPRDVSFVCQALAANDTVTNVRMYDALGVDPDVLGPILEAMAAMAQLRHLALERENLETCAPSFHTLLRSSNIQRLELLSCQLNDASFVSLLPTNHTMTSLRLHDIRLGDAPMAELIVDALFTNGCQSRSESLA